jgi:hypothetical protein
MVVSTPSGPAQVSTGAGERDLANLPVRPNGDMIAAQIVRVILADG